MVTPMESSQWRAVASPWAWNARRRGWVLDNRGGSVVLRAEVCEYGTHMRGRSQGIRVHGECDSPAKRIEDVPDHSALRAQVTRTRMPCGRKPSIPMRAELASSARRRSRRQTSSTSSVSQMCTELASAEQAHVSANRSTAARRAVVVCEQDCRHWGSKQKCRPEFLEVACTGGAEQPCSDSGTEIEARRATPGALWRGLRTLAF